MRAEKWQEFDAACSAAITEGADIETSHGLKRFTFTLADQNNIKDATDTIFAVRLGVLPETMIAGGIPFKASDGQCLYYTVEDISKIDMTKKAHILYNRTYLSALLAWSGTLTKEELAGVKYGSPDILPAEYQAHITEVMTPIMLLLSASGGEGA